MKAISLHQPYASLVAAGIKTTETRSWPTYYRGPIAIHAAKRWTKDEREAWQRFSDRFGERFPRLKCVSPSAKMWVGDLPPLGAIVAVAEVSACAAFTRIELLPRWVTQEDVLTGDTSPGRFGWRLDGVRPLSTPLEVKGRQGLWTLTEEEAAEVLSRASGPHSLTLRAR